MKEPSYVNGMKELHLSVTYHSGKEIDAYVAKNYAYFANVLKEMGVIK
jgi:tripartite-type tricarboxylate transporter receptor subunit TctC